MEAKNMRSVDCLVRVDNNNVTTLAPLCHQENGSCGQN